MYAIRSYYAILFSCLGMLGLVSFVLRRKTKEIGIRKTMGASAGRIFLKVMREFVLLVVLANVVTLPLAYVLLSKLMAIQTRLDSVTGWRNNFV